MLILILRLTSSAAPGAAHQVAQVVGVYQSFAPPGSRVWASHGQPCSRTQRSTSTWPLLTAKRHVHQSQLQPSSRSHCTNSRWPFKAAFHLTCLSIAKPPSPHSHFTSSRCPCSAAT